MKHNTQVEVMSVDGTQYAGTVVKNDEKDNPDYLILTEAWILKNGGSPIKKANIFIRTSNITYITNV